MVNVLAIRDLAAYGKYSEAMQVRLAPRSSKEKTPRLKISLKGAQVK